MENRGKTPLIGITLISNLGTFNSTDFCRVPGGRHEEQVGIALVAK